MRQTILLVVLCCQLQSTTFAQMQKDGKILLDIDSTRSNMQHWNDWLNNLYEMGIRNQDDSFRINQEVIRLIKDSVYRKSVYPESYTVAGMVELMKKQELKNAFWYMINLYQNGDTLSRNTVLRTILSYDALLQMDKILVSTFYTYGFLDPSVTKFDKGKPVISRPDLLELKFYKLKEMLGYIMAYRQLSNAKLGRSDSTNDRPVVPKPKAGN